jgi:hypothetical protein
MFASLLITLWLTSLVVAVVWAARLALRAALAAGRLTIRPPRDLIRLVGFGSRIGRQRLGESRCA